MSTKANIVVEDLLVGSDFQVSTVLAKMGKRHGGHEGILVMMLLLFFFSFPVNSCFSL
jgi:hypothetical protein